MTECVYRQIETRTPLQLFGSNVKRWRVNRGLSQRELSRRAAWSVGTQSMIESGKINTTLAKIVMLSRKLNVPIDVLMEGVK